MANYTDLKAAIASVIKTNGNNEITGQLLQNTLNSIVNQIASGKIFSGVASPATNPGTPDANVFWLAGTTGLYSNFGGKEVRNTALIFYNDINGAWQSYDTGLIVSNDSFDFFSVKGSYLNSAGVATATVNAYNTTDYLPINRRKAIIIQGIRAGIVYPIAFYDSKFKPILVYTGAATANNVYTYQPEDIPANAAYIRCTEDLYNSVKIKGQIYSGVDMDSLASGIKNISIGMPILDLSYNSEGTTYNLREAVAAVPSTLIKIGLFLTFIDKYTNKPVTYRYIGGTTTLYNNWTIVEDYAFSRASSIASIGELSNNVSSFLNIPTSGTPGFYDINGNFVAGSFYSKNMTLSTGDYFIVHCPYANLHSFVEDENGNKIYCFNQTRATSDLYNNTYGGGYIETAYRLVVPAGKTYTLKLSSMYNRFYIAEKQISSTSIFQKLTKTISSDTIHKFLTAGKLSEVELTTFKDGFYISVDLVDTAASNSHILTGTLQPGTHIVQSRAYGNFHGKVLNSAGKIVQILNTKNGQLDYPFIFVPNGEVYTLYLPAFKPGVTKGTRYNYPTKVYRITENVSNDFILKSLKDIVLNSLDSEHVSFEKTYNQFVKPDGTIASSGLTLYTDVTVPKGVYRIKTMLGSDTNIAIVYRDENGFIIESTSGSSATSGDLIEVIIDMNELCLTDNVRFTVSGVQYGKSVNTNFPQEITIERLDKKISGKGEVSNVEDVPFSGDINVTPIHGQSLSLAVVHAVPALHTYKDTFGLMFNDYVYQVGSTQATLLSINPLYEKTQESSAYGTATMIRRAVTQNKQSELLRKCVYMTAGRDGGALATMVKGTSYYNSLTAAMIKAKALNPNKVVKFPAIYIIQGESDAYGLMTPYQNYYDMMLQFRQDLQNDALAILGQTTPVKLIIYQMTSKQNVENVINIQMAHLNLVLENENFVMSTPMYILDYVADQVHIGNKAEYILGGYQGLAYKKSVVDKQRALPLHCRSIQQIASNKLLLRFNVPVPPLVFDDTLVTAIQNNGFKVLVDNVDVLQSTELYMDDGVILTCSQDVTTGTVTYAYFLELGTKTGRTQGPRGNLRDSQGDQYTLPMPDNTEYRMDNYCATFKKDF